MSELALSIITIRQYADIVITINYSSHNLGWGAA